MPLAIFGIQATPLTRPQRNNIIFSGSKPSEDQSRSFRLLVSAGPLSVLGFVASGRHTQVQNVCTVSVPAVTWSCTSHIPTVAQPSLSSWPSCERLVLFGPHILTVSDRIVACLEQRGRPGSGLLRNVRYGLSLKTHFASFVLCHFMLRVSSTFLSSSVSFRKRREENAHANLSFAESLPNFGDVDLATYQKVL